MCSGSERARARSRKVCDKRGLVAADVVADDVDLALLRLAWRPRRCRNATNCSLVWRGAVLAGTLPVAGFRAANRLRVPLRLYSKP